MEKKYHYKCTLLLLFFFFTGLIFFVLGSYLARNKVCLRTGSLELIKPGLPSHTRLLIQDKIITDFPCCGADNNIEITVYNSVPLFQVYQPVWEGWQRWGWWVVGERNSGSGSAKRNNERESVTCGGEQTKIIFLKEVSEGDLK